MDHKYNSKEIVIAVLYYFMEDAQRGIRKS